MNKDNKKLVVESNFIKETLKHNLSLDEFLLLLYFDNSFNPVFDLNIITDTLKMSEEKVLNAFSNLVSKKLIKVEAVKNDYGKISEKVSLEGFYQDIVLDERKKETEKKKEDIFSTFEKEFGRPLSSMDFEILNAWIDKGFKEELIIAALKEAVYNGVVTLKYIDKILYEWNKKGITVPEEILKKEKEEDPTLYETKVLDFDWLDENK